MNRTVTISNVEDYQDCLKVEFFDGKKVVGTFTFWNYIGYGDILTREVTNFIKYGQLPSQQHGFIKQP